MSSSFWRRRLSQSEGAQMGWNARPVRTRSFPPATHSVKLATHCYFSPMLEPTPLYGGNADFLEGLYEQYLRDPASVDARWRGYFERMAPPAAGERSHSQIQAEIAERARAPKALAAAAAPAPASPDNAAK